MIASKATWIFIRRSPPNQLGADTSLRLGDLTLRKLHYQTALANRQPLAKPPLIATIHRAKPRSSLRADRSREGVPDSSEAMQRLGTIMDCVGASHHGMTITAVPATQCDPSHIWFAARHEADMRFAGLTFAVDGGLVGKSANRATKKK
jgi:hypothetical protein